MSRAHWILIALMVAVGGTAIGANYLVEIRLKNIQSAGSAANFTSINQQPVWNFVGGFAYNADGGHYNVGVSEGITASSPLKEAVSGAYASTLSCPWCAQQNPDLGPTLSPRGSQISTITAKPSCVAALVNTFWSEDGGADGGTRLFMCMHKQDTSYAWVIVKQAG